MTKEASSESDHNNSQPKEWVAFGKYGMSQGRYESFDIQDRLDDRFGPGEHTFVKGPEESPIGTILVSKVALEALQRKMEK